MKQRRRKPRKTDKKRGTPSFDPRLDTWGQDPAFEKIPIGRDIAAEGKDRRREVGAT
jgi:hypothetical protein